MKASNFLRSVPTACHIFLLILLNVIWGGTYVASKIAMDDFMPITLAFVRFAIASLIMIPFLLTKYRKIRLDKKDFFLCSLLGLLGITLAYIFQNIGVKMTKTMNAAIEISSEPIMMIILAAIFLKEKVTPKIIFGVILSFIGVLVIILPSSSGASSVDLSHPNSALGDILVLLSALFCALYTIIGNAAIKRLPSFVVTAYAVITGTIFLFPFAAFYENGLTAIATASLKSWICVFYLSVLATSFAYLVWYLILEQIEASFMGNFLNLQPLVGIALGWFLLNEPVGGSTFSGAALIIGGIYITSSKTKKIEEKVVIEPA